MSAQEAGIRGLVEGDELQDRSVDVATNGSMHPSLALYAECFSALSWPVLIVDADWRLVWASNELLEFVRAQDQADVGYGLHIAEALTTDPWVSAISSDSLGPLFAEIGPYLLHDLHNRNLNPEELIPAETLGFLESLEPKEPPEVFQTRFSAVDPADPELPSYGINVCSMQVRDENGESAGWVSVMFIGVRPKLLALLARGDEEMYERMARLVDPRPRQGAMLFCDLESGDLSRQLPSAQYFRLARQLSTGIDQVVADNTGIVGKHTGDGAAAYFLVDDLGSASQAAAAAVATAARIQEMAHEVLAGVTEKECSMTVGLHWGGTLYMGQLVPGSRLDVTALGDEVNQALRVQEVAGGGETLVSKQLLEQLTDEDAQMLGIDVDRVSYRLLGELAPESEKVVRDAGALPVTSL